MLTSARILNVNDHPAMLHLSTRLLQRAGYEVIQASTGEEALSLARGKPDLVLLDTKLPDMVGFDVCKRLKADPETAHIPVLQTSAVYASPEQRTRGLEAGADGYLAQPFDEGELLALVNALLRARREAAAAVERSDRLFSLSSALAEAITTEQVLEIGLSEGLKGVAAEGGAVLTLTVDEQALEVREQQGRVDPSLAKGARLPLDGSSTLAKAISADAPIYVEGGQSGSRAEAALPIRLRGKLLGAVSVQLGPWRTCDAGDRQFLTTLARQLGLALDRARLLEEAREVARSREELLAIVAHDLRNPLSTVVTSAGMLKRDGPGQSPDRFANRIAGVERAAARMNRLIQDLLDLARFQAGTLSLSRSAHLAGELLAEAQDSVIHAAQARGISLEVEPCDPSLAVSCDRERLLQVFANLIGNAIKFSPEGSQVLLSAAARGDEVVFRVTDQGPGVSESQLDRLFHRFFQADPAHRGGVGLGLSIAKAIVEAHGGTIGVQSTLGQGSTFWFELPRAPAAPARASVG